MSSPLRPRYSTRTSRRLRIASLMADRMPSASRCATGVGVSRSAKRPNAASTLRAHVAERGARAGRDLRPDEVERHQDRLRLERREARRAAELLAVQLLLDLDRVAVELGVDGVAAAAEVDEVEQVDLLDERVVGEPVALLQIGRRDLAARLVAAALEQVGQHRLQHREALGRDRAGAPRRRRLGRLLAHDLDRCRDRRHVALVGVPRRGPAPLATSSTSSGGETGSAWPSMPITQRREQLEAGVRRGEARAAVVADLDRAVAAEQRARPARRRWA